MFSKTYTGSFAQKAVSIISLFVLVVGVFPAQALAVNGPVAPTCGQTLSYTVTGDTNDFFNVNFESNDVQIDVSADSGYTITKVEVDFFFDQQGDGNSDDDALTWIQVATGPVSNLNPQGGDVINAVRVTVTKLCFAVTIDESVSCGSGQKTFTGSATYAGDTSTRLRVTFNPPGNNNTATVVNVTNEPATWSFTQSVTAGSTYTIEVDVWDDENANGQSEADDTWTFTVSNCAPPPPVDVCPNVAGTQTVTPCADTQCVADGGTWSNNQCTIPTTNVCHQTGNSWEPKTVNNNALSGHLGHGDFVIDTEHPCPPAPPQVDVCPNVTGMQTTGPCADTLCPVPTTWNTQSQMCVPPVVVDVCPNVTGTQTETPCADTACVTPNTWNAETQNCVPPVVEDIDLCPEDGFQTTLPCATVTPPTDTDDDGIADESDNCPAVANADQTDSDENGTGDACENQEATPEPEAPKKNRGHIDPVCNNNEDDDKDGLYDVNDPDCADANGSSESPAIGGTSEGDVLGACSAILDSYIGLRGIMADPAAVKVLQTFLNKELGLSLEVNGEYDATTIEAVKAFQTKYSIDVLSPWGINESTGIVFKTTQRMINKIACPTLDIPMPELN